MSTELARVVTRAARGRTVRQVNLRIGALRQVVPASLDYAWGFVTASTPLEGAALVVDWIDAAIECARGHRTQLDAASYLDLACPQCDAPTTVVAGEEFQVVDIEVDTAE